MAREFAGRQRNSQLLQLGRTVSVNETAPAPRRRKFWKYLLFLAVLSVVSFGGLAWYATTDSFQQMVRRRLIAELELITGGRVELGSFHTPPFRLRVDVRNLTIYGLANSGDVPYAHVDRLVAQVKIISAVGAEFGVDSLVLEHPVVHVVFFQDGTTNQPQPRVQRTSDKNAVEELFSL